MLVATGYAAASNRSSFTKLTDCPLNQPQKRNKSQFFKLNSIEIVLHALLLVCSSISCMLGRHIIFHFKHFVFTLGTSSYLLTT